MAVKINEVMHASFNDQCGYEFYMESDIMKKLKIVYSDVDLSVKGSIARMITIRKVALAKLINKRSEKTHQKKIVSKRQPGQKLDDSVLRDKFSFQISMSGVNDNKWYMRDGTMCDGTICNNVLKNETPKFNPQFYIDKIRKLELQLKAKDEVC